MKIECKRLKNGSYSIEYTVVEENYTFTFSHKINNIVELFEFKDLANSIEQNIYCRIIFDKMRIMTINSNTIFNFMAGNQEMKILIPIKLSL